MAPSPPPPPQDRHSRPTSPQPQYPFSLRARPLPDSFPAPSLLPSPVTLFHFLPTARTPFLPSLLPALFSPHFLRLSFQAASRPEINLRSHLSVAFVVPLPSPAPSPPFLSSAHPLPVPRPFPFPSPTSPSPGSSPPSPLPARPRPYENECHRFHHIIKL